MDRATIAKLATQAAQGSRDAFEQLYQLTKQRVYFVAVSITKNDADAQDIVQESYLKAMQNLGQLEQPESFVNWLARITANQAKNYISRKQPTAFSEYGDGDAAAWQEETDRDFLPDERLDLDETKRHIARIVGELPEDQRLCVLLHYFDDMEVGAIAQTLSIPEGTVKSRLSRARAKLLRMLEDAQNKGLKLYGFAPMPLLAYFIAQLAQDAAKASESLPPLILAGTAATAAVGAAAASETTAAATGTTAAAGASSTGGAGAGVAAFAAGALPKVIAAVTVAGLAIGGTAVGVVLVRRNAAKNAPIAVQSSTLLPGQSVNEPGSFEGNPGIVSAASDPDDQQGAATPQGGSEARTSAAQVGEQPQSGAQAGSEPAGSDPAQPGVSAQTAQNFVTTTQPRYIFTKASTTAQSPNPNVSETQAGTQVPVTSFGTDAPKPPANNDFECSNGYVTKFVGSGTNITIPATVNGMTIEGVGSYLFAMHPSLVSVTIEEGISTIDQGAFTGCMSLERVTIPNSVQYIDKLAFSASPNVKIYCKKGSYADTFALQNHIDVVYI